jgi:hypothetical protein
MAQARPKVLQFALVNEGDNPTDKRWMAEMNFVMELRRVENFYGDNLGYKRGLDPGFVRWQLTRRKTAIELTKQHLLSPRTFSNGTSFRQKLSMTLGPRSNLVFRKRAE